jgi:hypothetical protein
LDDHFCNSIKVFLTKELENILQKEASQIAAPAQCMTGGRPVYMLWVKNPLEIDFFGRKSGSVGGAARPKPEE